MMDVNRLPLEGQDGLLDLLKTLVDPRKPRGVRHPVVTIVAAELPYLFGGAIITEQIFQWPGIGMLTVKRTSERDFPVLMGITVMSAIMILLSNLLADIAYAVVDPRIRYN